MLKIKVKFEKNLYFSNKKKRNGFKYTLNRFAIFSIFDRIKLFIRQNQLAHHF